MAWLLLGIPAAAAVGYVGYEANKLYESFTAPIYDYFKKEEEDKNNRILEEIRQDSIDRTNKMYEKHDGLRERFKLKSNGNIIKLINNCNVMCTVIYVNKYLADNNEKGAIEWAKKVIDITYVELGLTNKISTKKSILKPNTDIKIIPLEIKEYFIVLHLNNKYIVLDKIDFENININVKDTFTIKNNSADDEGCKGWF
jgi:hypothetical protein